MIKKLGMTAIALSALVLSGCGGGGGGSSDPMNDKKFVLVYTEVQTGICKSERFNNELSSLGLRDFITRETDNTSSCQTYGKKNDNTECAMLLISTGNKNCVVGFNTIPANFNGLARQVGAANLTDTVELISSGF